MKEKEKIKVSLGTAICVFIIFFLVIGIVAMYYFGFVKNNKKISDLESQTIALQEKVNSLQETKSTIELQTQKADDEIKELIKNYILTDFGPKNNMKNVTVDSYKEITAEEYFSKTPGGPWTEEEKTEFLKKNPGLMYGYCTFTIELIDANKLTMEGSSATYQEIVGNNFKSEAIFTLNKTAKEINFATSYGFGNKSAVDKNNNTNIVTIAMFYGDENLYVYLKDGYLYYYRGKSETDNSNVTKYTKLSNIEKIKSYNLGTSVNPAIYLITSEGKVYYTYATRNGGANNGLEFVIFEPMKDLKVDDILSKEGENIETFKVLLKNGNTETVKNDLGIF